MMADFLSVVLDVLLWPLQVVLIPVDALLAKIPGIGAVPHAINAVVSTVSYVPSTLVSIFGIQPILWNALFLIFILYIALAPSIQTIKKFYSWWRP